MSILSELKGESEPWEAKEGVKIPIYPLKIKEGMEDFMSLEEGDDPVKMAEAMSNIINKTLKRSVPDATQEEIDDIPLEYFQSLISVIMKVNKLDNTNVDADKVQKIKQLRERYKNQRKKK